jgi:predicted transcriptional regulator
MLRMLKHFSEVVVADILPGLRALLAKELAKQGLNQQQAATKLGVTQAAVSQYRRELRGWRIKLLTKDAKITAEIEKLAKMVAESGLASEPALEQLSTICKLVRERHFTASPSRELYPGVELVEPKE